MTNSEYRPVRILRRIVVAGTDPAGMKSRYPHGHPEIPPGGGTVCVAYEPGTVVDAPTDEERAIFDSQAGLRQPAARDIPQHADGYDIPTSGIARSRKGSVKGREIFRREMQARLERRAAETASRKPARKKPAGAATGGNGGIPEAGTAAEEEDPGRDATGRAGKTEGGSE